MSILGVEPDRKAPYAALVDKLASETQFFQSELLPLADGRTLGAQVQTILEQKERCRLAVNMNPQNLTDGLFLLDNVFNANDVVIQTAAAFNAAAAAASAAGTAPGSFNFTSAPINSLVISCRRGDACISQDYSDQRGRQPPLSSVSFNVPVGNVDSVFREFQSLQAMCSD